jgi:hypothetical protein
MYSPLEAVELDQILESLEKEMFFPILAISQLIRIIVSLNFLTTDALPSTITLQTEIIFVDTYHDSHRNYEYLFPRD